MSGQNDILKEICEYKLEHIKLRKEKVNLAEINDMIKDLPTTKGFTDALLRKINNHENALIAEIKKASPSKGLIRENYDPDSIAKAYEKGGATCLSVLTDEKYFLGHNDHLLIARYACQLPILRKDFMLDPYQVFEARLLGADCILLIMACLDIEKAKELEAIAFLLGLDVLVEIHNQEDLEKALELESRLIGINNRNLKNFEVNFDTSFELIKLIPQTHIVICESGIYNHSDILKMNEKGIFSFLVGEALMRQEDITLATKKLLGY